MEKTVAFGKHPSEKLQQAFSKKPFQIQEPEKAKIIFLGLDANWDKYIEKKQPLFFNETLEYLKDGIKYWKANCIHTPMLKETYKGDGKRYHTQFRKLGFSCREAEYICFLELLSICTYGSSTKNEKKFMEMVMSPENKEHLERIRKIFKLENIICISKGVERIIKENRDKLGINIHRKNIIPHIHFSGSISNEEINELGKRLWKYLGKCKD